MPPSQHQASSVLAELLRTLALRLLHHLRRPQGLTPVHAPRVFVDQVADAAFCGGSIGLTVVEGMHTRQVRHGVKDWSVLLRGIEKVHSVTGATARVDALGTLLTAEQGLATQTIQL